jgi:hypothetical protein
MTEIRVTTQAELDATLARTDLTYDRFEIVIDSPAGVWIDLADSKGLDVMAYDRASVEAYGSASVRASGSASVRAYDRASVRAYDRASVEASGSASVRAYGSASVRAGRYVAVHLYSQRATLHGGVLIDMTSIDETDPQQWCDLHGVTVDEQGLAHLYKAVDDEWMAGHSYVPTTYWPGTDPECDTWRDDHDCGGGLHACTTAWMALDHYREATRFVEVTAPVDTLRPIDNTKAKMPTVHVLREVTRDMKPVNGDE